MALHLNLSGTEFGGRGLWRRRGALCLSESGAVVDFLPRVARRPVEPLSPPDHRGSAASLTLGAISTGYGGTVTWLGIVKD